MLTLLLACASPAAGPAPSPAQHYEAALVAVDYVHAMGLCAGTGAMEDDCQDAIVDRFARYDGCDSLRDPGECHFLYAEHLARVDGRAADGVRECKNAAAYAVDCDEHLIGDVAMQGDTVTDAVAEFSAIEPDLVMHAARAHFFRGWFHERFRRGESPDPESCPDAECRNAGRYEARLARDRSQ